MPRVRELRNPFQDSTSEVEAFTQAPELPVEDSSLSRSENNPICMRSSAYVMYLNTLRYHRVFLSTNTPHSEEMKH